MTETRGYYEIRSTTEPQSQAQVLERLITMQEYQVSLALYAVAVAQGKLAIAERRLLDLQTQLAKEQANDFQH